MTEAEYTSQIQNYNRQLSEYQSELNTINKEIEEAEEALRDIRSYSNRFYEEIDKNKIKAKELIKGNGLKALVGFSNQLNEKLTGTQFKNADQSLTNIIDCIKRKLNNLYMDYNQYEGLIETTRGKMISTQNELDSFRRSQAAEAERARQNESTAIEQHSNVQLTSINKTSSPKSNAQKSLSSKSNAFGSFAKKLK